MVILYVLDANPESTTAVLLAGMSLVISDAWPWKRWQLLLNFLASTRAMVARRYFHTTVN